MAAEDASGDGGPGGSAAYAVLARKYRPQDFDALIGQEALVRVLTNAFERDRIPHAMLLTGVRGVGKTTTARIVAKGLNCSTFEGPTVTPCGRCDNCVAIAESRHVDVMEMDAASRTGIDDIREIIESVRYRANIGRYKVYIIDETHMLSKSAFNGLLKTLEEPPPHVKFILATTDAHKLPATVLSRCMRFDLRRVAPERMIAHLTTLCEAEGVTAEPAALALVARASEGSVRDALSLLDQAIAHGAGVVEDAAVRDMLGLAETGRAFELLEAILTGAVGPALERLNALYRDGADPGAILSDVAAACHAATVMKATPERAETARRDATLSPAEIELSEALAARTPMRALARCWQMLLKALEEVATAPAPLAAAEMAVIRLCYVSELPSPEQALRRLATLGDAGVGAGAGASAPNGAGSGGRAASAAAPPIAQAATTSEDAPPARGPSFGPSGGSLAGSPAGPPSGPAIAPAAARSGGGERPRLVAEAAPASAPGAAPAAPSPAPEPAPMRDHGVARFEDIVALIREHRDAKLLVEVERFVRPGPLGANSFEFTPAPGAPPSLAATLAERLRRWTGARWIVSIAEGHDGSTLAERAAADDERARQAALAHPLVRAALDAFPGAELAAVRALGAAPEAQADEDALLEAGAPPGLEDAWGGDWEPEPYGEGFDDEVAPPPGESQD